MAAEYRPPISSATQAALTAEATTRAGADTALTAADVAEAAARAAADSAEATARTNAINSAITGEASARAAADTANATAIAAEATARANADALLIPLTQKGANNGVASLDSGGDVPVGQLGNVPAPDLSGLATTSALTAHTGASSGAHAASAVSFTPGGTVSATTVQAAVAEVASEADTRLLAVESSSAAAALKAANLSDLASASTARTNLGLGSAATQSSAAFDAAGAAAAAQGRALAFTIALGA